MAVLTIKNLSERTYSALKERAKANQRSLNREAIVCLEEAVGTVTKVDESQLLERLARLRSSLTKVNLTEDELAESINSGRP